MPKYFSEQDYAGEIEIDPSMGFKLVKTDTYDEDKIKEALKKTGMVEELKCCAVQTAIVGSGKNNLGSVLIKGVEVPVSQVYKDAGVKIDLPQSTRLEDCDLTPRRLQRYFRYTISNFMRREKVSSYLYTKYSDHDEKYKYVIFPGSEHLLTDDEGCKYLYHTYLRLDFQLNTNISERIYRVLQSRGKLTMAEMDSMKQKFIELKKSLNMIPN